MSRSKIVNAINELLSQLGSNTFKSVDKKTLNEVKRKYNEEDKQVYLNLIDYWTRASSVVFEYLESNSLIKEEGISFNKKMTTHAYLKIGDKKHDLHSLNKYTYSDCLPISILMLFLVTRTKLEVETIQGFLEDRQEYLKNLLESTRFFLYLVGSLNEDQSFEILFNLMFFLKGEHRTESKSGKRSETKISYNERIVSPKENKENNAEWSCTVCTFSNHFLMDKCEICHTSR